MVLHQHVSGMDTQVAMLGVTLVSNMVGFICDVNFLFCNCIKSSHMVFQASWTSCIASEGLWTLIVWDLFCVVVCFQVIIHTDSFLLHV